jgi:heme exporter protein A
MTEAFALQAETSAKRFGHFTAPRRVLPQCPTRRISRLVRPQRRRQTTFLKIAATLIRHTHGNLRIEGLDIREEPEQARRHIGFLSHNTYLYRDLNPVENLPVLRALCTACKRPTNGSKLCWTASVFDAAHPTRFARSREVCTSGWASPRVMLHDPSLILLDEPYTGLDANAVDILNQLLDEARAGGKTIILTTHDLEQGLRGATRAAIIDRGKVCVRRWSPGRRRSRGLCVYIRAGVNR